MKKSGEAHPQQTKQSSQYTSKPKRKHPSTLQYGSQALQFSSSFKLHLHNDICVVELVMVAFLTTDAHEAGVTDELPMTGLPWD